MENWQTTNDRQTHLTEEAFSKLTREVQVELLDIVSQIELVGNMINPTRRRVSDMPKDKRGRAIIDLENPHILEDMSYFTIPAATYKKYGVFTRSYPNAHPQSQYVKFWKEEAKRCKHGCIRPDGEWITGYHYFYLNYSPILIAQDIEDDLSQEESEFKRAERIEDFPHIWDGDYLYFHYIEKGMNTGKYGTVLKTRGRGFSFKGGSMAARNQLFFKKSRTFMMASEKEYLNKDGIWNKYMDVRDFLGDTTQLPYSTLKDDQSSMNVVLGYKDAKTLVNKGLKSEVHGVTLKDNPQKARGKRGMLIQWEEAGKFPGLLTAWSIARMSLEQGRSVFGYMVAFGTGGTEGANFEALESLFYNPKGYKVYSMRNVFDKTRGKGECAFFFPEYLNRQNCYDEDGNSDVIKALIEILEDREEVRKGTDQAHALTQEKADRPITPQEAVMRKEGNLFPVEQLKDYLVDISPTIDSFFAEHIYGNIHITKEGAKLNQDVSNLPIRDFPMKSVMNRGGAVEIFEPPRVDAYGEIPWGRYIAGIDPYDDDEGASLGSILVMDLWTDRIVAEYTGRKETANEFYETCAGLLIHYNAQGMYESNKKGLYGWFYNNNLLHYLADTPEILKDMDFVKIIGSGNKGKGINVNKEINKWGRRLQADWQRELAYSATSYEQQMEIAELVEKETDDMTELTPEQKQMLQEVPEPNLRKIRSVGYIKECIAWNEDGNFDRVSAGNMLFIFRAQKKKYTDLIREEVKTNHIANDDFFNRNYHEPQSATDSDVFERITARRRGNPTDLADFKNSKYRESGPYSFGLVDNDL
jgi:hypothetical protein